MLASWWWSRRSRIAAHQSTHNSGVIHAGVYYAPGSLKAQLCVEGAARMYAFCEQTGVDVRRLGKLIIATGAHELPALDELERRSKANGVPGMRRLAPEEIAEIEPHAVGAGALHSPHTGIVDFGAVSLRLAEEFRAGGGELRLRWKVDDVVSTDRGIRLIGPEGDAVEAARAVFCAGLWSDRSPQGQGRRLIRGSFPFVVATCAWSISDGTWSAASSTRCPTRACRFSAFISRRGSMAKCWWARRRCWSAPGMPIGLRGCAAGTWLRS